MVVVSPDVGGVKRAEAFRAALEQRIERPVALAFMEKYRSAGVVSGEALVGEVEGCHVIVIDDLISSGTTLKRALHACRERGAASLFCAATHGLFTGDVMALLEDSSLDRLVVTDSVAPPRLPAQVAGTKLVVISAAPLVGEAIRRLHTHGSLDELLHR